VTADPTGESLIDRWRREDAELEARYTAIDRAWDDSGIPTYVLQTPDWQSGWRVLHDWLGRHDFRGRDPEAWEKVVAGSWPKAKTSWFTEIHMFSHMHSPYRGHHSAHVAIEEEGARAILAWWHDSEGNR
jgi:hypothetical protein